MSHSDIVLALRDTGLLLLAWVLGGLIGWQREATGRAAGLRTHMLVSLGSCLLSLVSFAGFGDRGRIAAQIVSGIGFLGAGVILRRGVSVRGLTTAATVWLVAGIGIAVGAGGLYALLATTATLLSLVTLAQAKRLEKYIGGKRGASILMADYPRREGVATKLIETITSLGGQVAGYEHQEQDENADPQRRYILLTLQLRQDIDRDEILHTLAERFPESRFSWDLEGD